MAKITIGDEEYTIPELNFMALERAWPFIEQAMVISDRDPLLGPQAALRIIAAGICEDEKFQPERFNVTATPDDPDKVYEQVVLFFRKKLKARDIEKLQPCIEEIIKEAGLQPDEEDTVGNGEETPSLSTETVAAS